MTIHSTWKFLNKLRPLRRRLQLAHKQSCTFRYTIRNNKNKHTNISFLTLKVHAWSQIYQDSLTYWWRENNVKNWVGLITEHNWKMKNVTYRISTLTIALCLSTFCWKKLGCIDRNIETKTGNKSIKLRPAVSTQLKHKIAPISISSWAIGFLHPFNV